MAEGKKSFIIYTSWRVWLDGLSNEQKGMWLNWMMDYCNDLEPDYPTDQAVKISCMMAKDVLKRDLQKYEDKRSRMNQINADRKLKQAREEYETKSTRNRNDIVRVNDNVNDNVNVNVFNKLNNNIEDKSSLSGKPNDIADEIIDFLNEKAESHYKHTESNRKFINARLKENYSKEDLKLVVECKVREWTNTQMEKYIRPETLFNATKFQTYINEAKKFDFKPLAKEDNGGITEL